MLGLVVSPLISGKRVVPMARQTCMFMILRGFRPSVPEATASSWLFQQTLQYHVIQHERMFARAPFVWDGSELRVILPLYTRELYGPLA